MVSESEAGGARDPEVRDPETVVLVQEQVPGLDVAMDDAVPVGRVERRCGLLEPGERLVCGRRPLAQPVLERAALEVLHDDERPVVPLADVEDRDRVRLPGETRRGQRLPREPAAQRVVARIPLGQDLDGNGSSEDLVLGAKDLAHAAVPDPGRVAIARRQELVRGRHARHGPFHSRIRDRRNLPIAGAFLNFL